MTERRIKRLSEMPLSKALDMEQDIAGPGKDYENEDFWAWALAAEMLEKRLEELEKQVEELEETLGTERVLTEIGAKELRERAETAEKQVEERKKHCASMMKSIRTWMPEGFNSHCVDAMIIMESRLSIARKALEGLHAAVKDHCLACEDCCECCDKFEDTDCRCSDVVDRQGATYRTMRISLDAASDAIKELGGEAEQSSAGSEC